MVRKSLPLFIAALLALGGLVYGMELEEVYDTGWVFGVPDYESIFMFMFDDLNGDGLRNLALFKSTDQYYTDLTELEVSFFGPDFEPFWTLEGAGVSPSYAASADVDDDGAKEIVLVGQDHDWRYGDDDIPEITRSLVEMYQVGSQNLEWDFESGQGVILAPIVGPSTDFDYDEVPDIWLEGQAFNSLDSYLYRHTGANDYELLAQMQGVSMYNIPMSCDFDFDGDQEILICSMEDGYQTECELKLFDYDEGSDKMEWTQSWYFDCAAVIPLQITDIDEDGDAEMLLRVWDSSRAGYNLQLVDSVTQDVLFSCGEDLAEGERVNGGVFWNGPDTTDMDLDGNPDIFYYTTTYEEDTQGDLRPVSMAVYVDEYEGGIFLQRFEVEDTDGLYAAQAYDLDGDGARELFLSFFVFETSTYTDTLIAYDPLNNYQPKFEIELDSEQAIGYTNPLRGPGVDLDDDGVAEFILDIFWRPGEGEEQRRVEIRNGATGAVEWSKEFPVDYNVSINWAKDDAEVAGYNYPSSDLTGNGKMNFVLGQVQYDDEDLNAVKYTVYGHGGVTPPHVEITVETDKAAYVVGEPIEVSLGCENTGLDVNVDVYVALVTPTGGIYCAPSWEAGVIPWLADFTMPGGFVISPPWPFFTIDTPSDSPPINGPGTYAFGAVLTEPGNFNNMLCDISLAFFDYGM
ncbi:hypothetical protein J7M28_08760 [bacterium]|nr:hypothetical protein [bacterium]